MPNAGLHQMKTSRGILKSTISRMTKLNNQKGGIIKKQGKTRKRKRTRIQHQILHTLFDKSFSCTFYVTLDFVR